MDPAFPAGQRNLTSLPVKWEGEKAAREEQKLIIRSKQMVSNVAAGDSSKV